MICKSPERTTKTASPAVPASKSVSPFVRMTRVAARAIAGNAAGGKTENNTVLARKAAISSMRAR